MTGGDSRHGRRDNGLVAAQYAAAGDVDPRVGEHLLDVLAVDGIAAYLRPSTDIHPITRSSVLPNRPTDRLYVDLAHLETARGYLARLAADAAADQPVLTSGAESTTPPPAHDADTDDVWAAIVAGYDAEVAPAERSWPAAEDLTARPDEPAPFPRVVGRATPRSVPPPPDPEPSLLDGLDTFGAALPDDLEEGYTPPAPPPVPRPSMPTVLGVAGIVLGLFVFLKPNLLPIMSESTVMLLGFTAVVAGFGTLVWRLRPGDDDDSDRDPDDGARV